MFKVTSFIPQIVRCFPFPFPSTEKKIAAVLEKFKDPNLKVIVISEKKSKFTLIRNCAILAFVFSFFQKKSPPQEKVKSFSSLCFYSPLSPFIHQMQKGVLEKKANEYGIELFKEGLENIKKIIKDNLYLASDFLITLSSSKEVKMQKKQIEQLIQENTLLKNHIKTLETLILEIQKGQVNQLKDIEQLFLQLNLKIDGLAQKLDLLNKEVETLALSLDAIDNKTSDQLNNQKEILKENSGKIAQIFSDLKKIEEGLNKTFFEKIRFFPEKKDNISLS